MTRRALIGAALAGLAFWRVRKPKYEPPAMVSYGCDFGIRMGRSVYTVSEHGEIVDLVYGPEPSSVLWDARH